jgi:hypothetical protein
MKDKKNLVIFLLIIIIALLVGILICNNTKKEVKKENTNKNINFNLEGFYQIGEDLRLFDIAFDDSYSDYFGYLYNNQVLEVKDFDMKAALYLSLYGELNHDGETTIIQSDKVKENFYKIFGNNLEYKPMSFEAGRVFEFNYNEELNIYEINSPGVGGVYFPEIHLRNLSSTVNGNTVEVVRKMFYLEYSSNNSGTDLTKIEIYKNVNKSEKLGTMTLPEKGVNEDKIFKKYGDKLDNYKFTFTKGDDGNYYFSKVEREK